MAQEKNSWLAKIGFWMLTVVMTGATGVVIGGGVNGWFVRPVEVESSDYCVGCGAEFVNISAEEYERMVTEGRSFVLLVDQTGCTTADKLRGFVLGYAGEHDLRVYRMMFSEMKNTTLRTVVKHYPSIVVLSYGEVARYLRADADEDAGVYNNEDDFREWISKNIAER